MMIAAILLAASPPPEPPADWDGLPELPYLQPQGAGDVSGFVRQEVNAGRCPVSGQAISVDLAVLIGETGVLRIVPRAIDCPTVEQYAAGIATRLTRGSMPTAPRETWYRTSISFTWGE